MKIKELLGKKFIRLVLVSALLLTIFCIFQICKPNATYHFQGETVFEVGVEQPEAIIYDHISLPAGVYDVVLEYQTNTNMKNICSAFDGTVFNGGLLTNGEHLHEYLNNTDYKLWLFESTDEMQIRILYCGEGELTTGNLTICETNALWTMFLTVLWSIVIVVIGVSIFLQYDRTVGLQSEKKSVMVGLFLITLIASLPFLQDGVMIGADLGYHLMRIEGVKDGILSGQFPLRIEPEWLYGHGYANSIFYCNTLLYFPAILRLLGFTVNASFQMYCIGINIATVCIGYYCFSRIFKDRVIGLICTALHTLSIFRIYKFVITAALGEGSAYTFMPLILYGLYRVFTEDSSSTSYRKSWIPIALGYAGLMQTHVLTCEITAFLTIIVCLFMIRKLFVKETFLVLAKATSAAIAMSCWYLVPFLDYFLNEDIHMHYVSARTIQDRGLYLPVLFFNWWPLGNNAMLGNEGMTESHAMGIGMVMGIGFAVFCVLWFSGTWKKERGALISLGKTACVLGGLLMLMSLNIFPWDYIQNLNGVTASLVSSIQFPNRFLGWGTVFLACVWGCLLRYFKDSERKWYYYLGVILILSSITTSSVYLTDYTCKDKGYHHIYNEEGMGFGYISGAEYLIEGTRQEKLEFAVPVPGADVELLGYQKEYLHVKFHGVNRGNTESYVDLPLLLYKGYRAYDTVSGSELQLTYGENNVVRVLLPAQYDGEVKVKFVSPISWRIGEIITYGWFFSFVASPLWKRRKKSLVNN